MHTVTAASAGFQIQYKVVTISISHFSECGSFSALLSKVVLIMSSQSWTLRQTETDPGYVRCTYTASIHAAQSRRKPILQQVVLTHHGSAEKTWCQRLRANCAALPEAEAAEPRRSAGAAGEVIIV